MQTMKRAKILSASAGSGKTYQLAYKYVRDVVERPELYRAILAVTFTNKATEEMKSRILREIHILAAGQKSNYLDKLCKELEMPEHAVRKQALKARTLILHDYSRFSVLTIDKFFQRIIRAFIKELGIDLNYNIELDHGSLLQRSADRLVEKIAEDADLKRWMLEFVEERINDGERWDMRGDLRSLGNEIFKERSKERTKLRKSKEELGKIVANIVADAERAKNYLKSLGQRAVDIITSRGLAADMFGAGRVALSLDSISMPREISESLRQQCSRLLMILMRGIVKMRVLMCEMLPRRCCLYFRRYAPRFQMLRRE